jgi:hypothetical protein
MTESVFITSHDWPGEGWAVTAGYPEVWSDHHHANSFWTAPSLCADMIFGKDRCGERRRVANDANEPPSLLGSRLTDAGQQPPHYLPVRIATGRDSLHHLLSEGLSLLFGLSLFLRKRHPFADDFSPRFVFRLHAQNPLILNDGRRQHILTPSMMSADSMVLL